MGKPSTMGLQARPVKTVNIRAEDSEVPHGQDRGRGWRVTAKPFPYRLRHQPVDRWLALVKARVIPAACSMYSQAMVNISRALDICVARPIWDTHTPSPSNYFFSPPPMVATDMTSVEEG